MMRMILLGLATLVSVPAAIGQVGVRLSTALETNTFGDLRRSQDSALSGLRNQLGIAAEATDQFPPFLALRADLSAPLLRSYVLGIEGGFSSSSGRLDYQDYSGSYRYDQLVERRFMGIYAERPLLRTDRLALHGRLGSRGSYSQLDLIETVVLVNEGLGTSQLSASQLSVSVQPEVVLDLRVVGPLRLFTHVGYEQMVLGGLVIDGAPAILDGDSNQSSLNWSGPRAGIGVSWQAR